MAVSTAAQTSKEKSPKIQSPKKANYNFFRESFLKLTPENSRCKLFCGGKKCKYCSLLSGASLGPQLLEGVYSGWVTGNILAMARPTTSLITQKDLIGQFKKHRIQSIVNLQMPWEHKDCSPNPLSSCGFSYEPEEFMKNEIFYYNFGWRDFGVTNMDVLLDMVKVLSFAVQQGSVAVHCHAGLGRTGVLIAAFLIWEQSLTATQAIAAVRQKRPPSIQTVKQIQTISNFHDFLKPLRCVFPKVPCSLEQYLSNQSLMLHGVEQRLLKYLPKIVYIICERLLELAGVSNDGSLEKKLLFLSLGDDIFYYERIAAQKLLANKPSGSDTDSDSINASCTPDYIRSLSRSPKTLRSRSKRFGNCEKLKAKSVSFVDLPSIIDNPIFLPPLSKTVDLSGKKKKLKTELPWEMYENQSTMRVSELPNPEAKNGSIRRYSDESSAVDGEGNINWNYVFDMCDGSRESLSTFAKNSLTNYQQNLEHRTESWKKIVSEKQPETLMLLLKDFLTSSLSDAAVPSNNVSAIGSTEKCPHLQRWLLLYIIGVFKRIFFHSEIPFEKIASFLCSWLSWSQEEDTIRKYEEILRNRQ